jgi:hypothetical protein
MIFDGPVRTDTDLYRLWQELMGPGGFGKRSLWLMFLGPDGRPTKVLVPIEDIPAEPDPLLVRHLHKILVDLSADIDIGSVPALLSRPGPARMTAADRRWAAAWRTDARPEITRWPMHLATYERIQVFAPDDLIAAS